MLDPRCLADFSNVLTKSTLETLAQADEFEMVREVQVRRPRSLAIPPQPLSTARRLTVIPSRAGCQEYFADYLTLLPSLFTLALPPTAPSPKVRRSTSLPSPARSVLTLPVRVAR